MGRLLVSPSAWLCTQALPLCPCPAWSPAVFLPPGFLPGPFLSKLNVSWLLSPLSASPSLVLLPVLLQSGHPQTSQSSFLYVPSRFPMLISRPLSDLPFLKTVDNYKALLGDITEQVLAVVLLEPALQSPLCGSISTSALSQDASLLTSLSTPCCSF